MDDSVGSDRTNGWCTRERDITLMKLFVTENSDQNVYLYAVELRVRDSQSTIVGHLHTGFFTNSQLP